MNRIIRNSSLAAIALIAACSSDSSVAPSPTPVDLATAFSEMQVPGLTAAASIAGGATTPSLARIPTGCNYAASSQSFVCPAVTQNGLTITSSYSLLNASGNSMSQFDAKTIASLRVRSSVAGTTTVEGTSLKVSGEQDQTLSGLQTSSHTLNGTTTFNMSGTGTTPPVAGALDIKSTTTISSLVLPVHGSTNPYPTSGTVAVDQSTTLGSAGALASRIVMTFNGTSKVGVTISVDGHTLPGCTIDLSKATPTCG